MRLVFLRLIATFTAVHLLHLWKGGNLGPCCCNAWERVYKTSPDSVPAPACMNAVHTSMHSYSRDYDYSTTMQPRAHNTISVRHKAPAASQSVGSQLFGSRGRGPKRYDGNNIPRSDKRDPKVQAKVSNCGLLSAVEGSFRPR